MLWLTVADVLSTQSTRDPEVVNGIKESIVTECCTRQLIKEAVTEGRDRLN